MRQLGDSHHFGRRVTRRGNRIRKPRTIAWEWLVLSARSPLRRVLDGMGDFRFLPDLSFARSRSEVEAITLRPLPKSADVLELARISGRFIALFSWLGVSDLHWENLAVGASDRGVVVAPLDIEIILSDFDSPALTRLIPEADPEYAATYRHAAGIRRLLPWLGKPTPAPVVLEMASAYRRTLELLDLHAESIADVLARLPNLRDIPIRVTLRGTDEYVRSSAGTWPPLLDAELEQMERGDIPYFFRRYGRPGLHYYADPSLEREKTLFLPGLEPLLPIARGLRTPSRKKLREEGLIALIGAFDHPSLSGTHRSGDLEVRFGARTLVVTWGKEELTARRDLRAFVGSVYLPCRCGEVRTVFVPAVTKCKTSAT